MSSIVLGVDQRVGFAGKWQRRSHDDSHAYSSNFAAYCFLVIWMFHHRIRMPSNAKHHYWLGQAWEVEVTDWIKKSYKGCPSSLYLPWLEESGRLGLENAIALEEELKAYFSNQAQVALLHGQRKYKEFIMQDFKDGKTDILSTTVIEVGVNVPNATIMVIMHADCFGPSQLLSAAIMGRGNKQSYAVHNPDGVWEETDENHDWDDRWLCSGWGRPQDAGSAKFLGPVAWYSRVSGGDIVEDYPIFEEVRKAASQTLPILTGGWSGARKRTKTRCA